MKNLSGPKREQVSSGLSTTDSQEALPPPRPRGWQPSQGQELPEAQDLSLARPAARQCVETPACRSWTEQGSAASSLHPASSLPQPILRLVYLSIKNKGKRKSQKGQQVGQEGSYASAEHKETDFSPYRLAF